MYEYDFTGKFRIYILLFTHMTKVSICRIIVQNHTLHSDFVNAHGHICMTCMRIIILLPLSLTLFMFYHVNHNIHVYSMFLSPNALSLNLNTSQGHNTSSYVFTNLLTHLTYTQKIVLETVRIKVMRVQ